MDAERAREEAEARRQRIIQGADERLGLVTGEKVKDEEPDEPQQAKLSGSARLAAMRKRRFKKGAAAKKEDEGEDEEPAAEKPSDTGAEEVAESKVEASAQVETELVGHKDEASGTEQSKESEPSAEEAFNQSQKKYLGVARMRRQKIKERQEAQQDANTTKSVEDIVSSEKVAHLAARKKRKIIALPILMHFITTILLFLAGFDVGWQQNQILTATVHTELAPRQLGLKIVQRGSNRFVDKLSRWSGNGSEAAEPLLEDEFAEPKGIDASSEVENIDPIFRIDLDKLTEADTLINRIARVAIFLHRLIFKAILMPVTIAKNLISGFTQLSTIPPLLCLVAIFIRQFVGKMVLGAKLPDIQPKDEKEEKDVVSMGKNFVKGFITNAFPKVFSVYDVWTHMRTDMFVVLCGLIVGFTLQYQIESLPLSARIPAEEITVVHAPPAAETWETTSASTTGDEL